MLEKSFMIEAPKTSSKYNKITIKTGQGILSPQLTLVERILLMEEFRTSLDNDVKFDVSKYKTDKKKTLKKLKHIY